VSALQVREADGLLELLIDDGKVNALSQALLDELNSLVATAAEARQPLLISGRAGCFSAGYNLKVMQAGGEARRQLRAAGDQLTLQLLEYPAPVVMASSGHALAKGALLLLCADYRIGVQGDFRIGLSEVAIGMTMPASAQALTRHFLQPSWMNRCVLNAQMLSPEQAVAAGFYDEACDPAELLPRARAQLGNLAELDRTAFAETKLQLRAELLTALRQTP
jgi:enoyl-CoA hydratase